MMIVDTRATRYISRTNLVLKHLFDKTREQMPVLSQRGTITTPQEALIAYLANDGYVKNIFDRQDRDSFDLAVNMVRTWSEDQQRIFHQRHQSYRALFWDASRTWHTSVRYIAFAQETALDVIALKIEAEWDEEKNNPPRFILTDSNDHRDNAKRIVLSHPTQGRYVNNEILMDHALQDRATYTHQFKLDAGVDYHLYCYSESIVCRGRSVYLSPDTNRPRLSAWRQERT